MKIKSMTATFGKLNCAHLELGDGLNLIHAPNEGGKSTWSAFWKAMLYGIDTRDRDKKGYLADKNHYQPWSGAPMEGEIRLEHQGRDITIRRGPKGSTPFGAFSAVYTNTGEKVPGLTAANCGTLLAGAGREVFERSAFIGAGAMSVSAAPELEKRIAALVSSGQEDVSYSQVEGRLREWLNRRRVNRSVGLIPKLEGELQQVEQTQRQLQSITADIARLEQELVLLEEKKKELDGEAEIHRRLAQHELNRRYGEAGLALNEAQAQLDALEAEFARFGQLPDKERLKQAQGELQYLKVLDEEIKQGELALTEAEEACTQAQAAAADERFPDVSGEEAVRLAEQTEADHQQAQTKAAKSKTSGLVLLLLGLLTAVGAGCAYAIPKPPILPITGVYGLLALAGVLVVAGAVVLMGRKKTLQGAAELLTRHQVQTTQELLTHARDYRARCDAAQEAVRHTETVRDALTDRRTRRETTHRELLDFVRSFEPQVNNLFGCSAALSRALSVDHELALARERVEERRRRRADLQAQGGQDFDTLEMLYPPERSPEQTDRALAVVSAKLEQVAGMLNQARGKQAAMGDPAGLAARQEELDAALTRRQEEFNALTIALEALKQANTQLQERFSPELNKLAGEYLARLTGDRYASVILTRELEGAAARPDDVLPHSVLYLSQGTADQLYLAVRLAVCRLCLPDKPPILLDDALAAFDDERMDLALSLLGELAQEQQILLFTCHKREGDALNQTSSVTHLTL